MFWESVAGQITAWSAAVAGFAAAVKGIHYLSERWSATKPVLKRVVAGVGRIIDLADEDDYPNGSTSIPTALHEIYDRQGVTHKLLVDHFEEAQQRWLHHLEEWHGHTLNPDERQ